MCEVVKRARKLAVEKGFDPEQVNCEKLLERGCIGMNCDYVALLEEEPLTELEKNQIEILSYLEGVSRMGKFYNRLEQTAELRGLELGEKES